MSANFYLHAPRGFMAGVDWHAYLAAAGPVPVPKPFHPHVVFSLLRADKHTSTVSGDGHAIWQKEGKAVPLHVPVPAPPPHVAEAGVLALVNLGASSEAKLIRRSVTGDGKPLACCVWECLGVNFNCGDLPPARFTDVVLNFASVKTKPDLGDFFWALASAIWEMGLEALLKWAVKTLVGRKIDELASWLKARLLDPTVRWLLNQLEKVLDSKIVALIKGKIADASEKIVEAISKWIQKQIGKTIGKAVTSSDLATLVASTTTALEGAA